VSEEELCSWFGELATKDGWTVYPETAGWDLLLVKDHVQIGVEAKLRANVDVLAQALRPGIENDGPRFHAVLVPKAGRAFLEVARTLRVVTFDRRALESDAHLYWYRQDGHALIRPPFEWFAWNHPDPAELPPIVPDVPAGVPSPRTLTKWKIGAIRICLRIRARGWVAKRDFTELGVSPSHWYRKWLKAGERDGRGYRWVPCPLPCGGYEDHAAAHRGVVDQLVAAGELTDEEVKGAEMLVEDVKA